MARISLRFDSRQFLLSHMRQPSGRGSWAFGFSLGDRSPWFAPGSLTLTEAKAAARLEVERRVAVLNSASAAVFVVADILP
jgi:hypothetical protein